MLRRLALLAIGLLALAGPALARPGDIDASFGSGGSVLTDATGGWEGARDGVVLPDGRIVVCGPGNGGGSFCVVRYLADGTVDSTFGVNGVANTLVLGTNTEATAIARQPDGRLVVAGYALVSGAWVSIVVRYTENGALDPTFNGTGRNQQTIGAVGDVQDVAVQPDGAILICGSFRVTGTTTFLGLRRYRADGTPDPGFGSGGTVTRGPGTDNHGMALRLLPGGRFLAVGTTDLSNGLGAQFLTFRFKANGTPDSTFGTVGRVITDVSVFADFARDVDVLPDGRILVGGHLGTQANTSHRYTIVCLDSTGVKDPGYGVNGIFTSPEVGLTTGYAFANDLLLLPSGRVLMAGQCTRIGTSDDFALLRVTADGAIDTTFGAGGLVLTDLSGGGRDIAYRMLARADGRLVVAGQAGTSLLPGAPFVALLGVVGDEIPLAAPEARGAAGLALGAAWPNPLVSGTRFATSLAERATVRLEVFDAAGRRVATPLDALLPAGTHTLAWDGRDADGARVADGVYFARLARREPDGRWRTAAARRLVVAH